MFIPTCTPGIIWEAALEEVKMLENGPKRLKIEKMLNEREEQWVFTVWLILRNYTRQKKKNARVVDKTFGWRLGSCLGFSKRQTSWQEAGYAMN